jgi:excisionase family DNA binding protein
MNRLEISETWNEHLTENEERQLEDGLRILARIIARAILKERSLPDGSRHKEYRDPSVHSNQVTTAGEPSEPLALSVKEAAKILGVSRNSAYTAVHTGQIPSIRFGSRILIPRVALEKMVSEADNRGPGHR